MGTEEKAAVQARAEVLAGEAKSPSRGPGAGTQQRGQWFIMGTARLGKPCLGRRLDKESAEAVLSVPSGHIAFVEKRREPGSRGQ